MTETINIQINVNILTQVSDTHIQILCCRVSTVPEGNRSSAGGGGMASKAEPTGNLAWVIS